MNRTPLDVWEASPKQLLVIREWGEFPALLRFAGRGGMGGAGNVSGFERKIFLGKAVIDIEGK